MGRGVGGRAPEGWRRTQLDVTDEAAVSALFAEMQAAWGGLDALCANAGIAGPTAAVEDIKLQDWQACVAVNLEGAFLAAKYAAPMMKAAGQGAIVVTSSTAGQYGYPVPRALCGGQMGGDRPDQNAGDGSWGRMACGPM